MSPDAEWWRTTWRGQIIVEKIERNLFAQNNDGVVVSTGTTNHQVQLTDPLAERAEVSVQKNLAIVVGKRRTFRLLHAVIRVDRM